LSDPIRIYSENNIFQHLETLRRKREKRHKHREFLFEGVRPINQALAFGWSIKAFVYTSDRPLSDWANGILTEAADSARGITRYEMPTALLDKLSGKTDPSELLALAAIPDDRLDRIPIRDDLRVVIFDRPANPGNLGSVIRTCDALGVHGLIMLGHSVDLYAPETISASTGSLFALPAVRMPSIESLADWFDLIRRRLGWFQLVGSDEDAPETIAEHDFTAPTILIAGNETWGMSAACREACDSLVKIPMGGSASSLNVSAATAIILYEIDRQRRADKPNS
jgi:TrmH family RNA methyltransferase